MKKKTIILSAVAAAFVLSVGCVSAFAAGSDTEAADGPSEAKDESAYSYLTGRQNSTTRNNLYTQAEELPEDEQDAFLAENGVGETPWSEEAAASYSYVGGRQRGASYRQDDDGDSAQDMSGYSYLTGQQRGSSYHK